MIAEKYQIRSSTQLKNWVKKYKECGEITDTRGENNKMKCFVQAENTESCSEKCRG